MNKNIILYIIGTVGVLAAGVALLSGYNPLAAKPQPNPKMDQFAQCLASKEMTMYGAYWCPHCQQQKKLFGDSFKYVKYVECTQDIKLCEEKKINGYPTWIMGDKRFEGEQTLEQLSSATSCSLN